ncbi:MAG: UPF0182 family protein [Syntrophobacteraceae bacterium]
MVKWQRGLLASIGTVLVASAVVLVGSFVSARYFVEYWWFGSLGYEGYFWQKNLYQYAVLVSVSVTFFLIFFLNFWVASRHLGTTTQPGASASPAASFKRYKELFQMFRTGSMWVYTPISVILAIAVTLPIYDRWEAFLLYMFAPPTGASDPVFHNDISYYLFAYPIYTLIQKYLLIAFTVLLLSLVVLYWLEKRILSRQEMHLPRGAKLHLSILVLLIFFIEIWDFILQRYGLVYSTSHLPLFSGPGYVEMNIIAPLIWIALIALAGTAFSLVYVVNTRKGAVVLGVFAAAFILATLVRYSDFLPQTVQKYVVKPNEISKERPYIANNIKSTLAAYKLDEVEVRNFNPERVPSDPGIPQVQMILRNTPVWDGELLDDVYKQLQELRTYYDFPSVDVDRYTVNNVYQQVFLSAREINQSQIPAGARNWVNEHLSYTHGYGAVMSPASQGGDEPMVWFIRGIPPESDYGFKIEQPGIYFGEAAGSDYIIAPNDAGEIDYPKGETNVLTSYKGKGGVPIHSLFKRLLFAAYFKDRNLFFTTNTTPESRILFRRNIRERIRILAPFLSLDRDPYLVLASGKLYWVQDAFTSSALYPASAPYRTESGDLNYIRNAVKVVVDAYDGTVDFYIFDPKDPIIRAYSRIYPGLFRDSAQMPAELKAHVRYPQDMFEIQMAMYAKYHQTDPEVFYQQEDTWEFANTYKGKEAIRIRPYYLTLDLVQPGRFDFLLLLPMSPSGRDNLRALTLVGCDAPHYGKLIVYNFPKGELVFGPSQIYALINQDTKVSEQFTLWDQAGSEVARGKMIILPIGRVILYIQPVYLRSSTRLKIPELKRLIVSQGQIVVMAASLEEAYEQLQQKMKSEVEKVDKRFAPLLTPAAPPKDAAPGGR